MSNSDNGKVIYADVNVSAPVSEVWTAWTTEAGARTFFAPDCRIMCEPLGPYEMYFDPGAPAGLRGGEGCQVLAVQPEKMLSFTWNAPPSIPEVRGHYTHVMVRLAESDIGGTKLVFIQDGWGEGGQWDQAFEYFTVAWKKVVLPMLLYRFEHGPVDWDNLPDLSVYNVK